MIGMVRYGWRGCVVVKPFCVILRGSQLHFFIFSPFFCFCRLLLLLLFSPYLFPLLLFSFNHTYFGSQWILCLQKLAHLGWLLIMVPNFKHTHIWCIFMLRKASIQISNVNIVSVLSPFHLSSLTFLQSMISSLKCILGDDTHRLHKATK